MNKHLCAGHQASSAASNLPPIIGNDYAHEQNKLGVHPGLWKSVTTQPLGTEEDLKRTNHLKTQHLVVVYVRLPPARSPRLERVTEAALHALGIRAASCKHRGANKISYGSQVSNNYFSLRTKLLVHGTAAITVVHVFISLLPFSCSSSRRSQTLLFIRDPPGLLNWLQAVYLAPSTLILEYL